VALNPTARRSQTGITKGASRAQRVAVTRANLSRGARAAAKAAQDRPGAARGPPLAALPTLRRTASVQECLSTLPANTPGSLGVRPTQSAKEMAKDAITRASADDSR
jgi:hypothetical protein